MKLKGVLMKKFADASANGVMLFFVPSWCDYGIDIKNKQEIKSLLARYREEDVRVSGRGIFGVE